MLTLIDTRQRLSVVASIGLVTLLCGASPASAQTAPSLGAAETFAVLAGSTITNTGPSVITGDLGLHPGTAVTGFPAGQIVAGTKHAANGAALAAKKSLTTAYDNLVGQPCTKDLTGQDLGGKTLTAGVYCFNSSSQLTGTLTLNALGNPNAVFIFKMGSTLTTASASKVNLINGASPGNVFWQVGSSATIGTTTSFVGNILAMASITVTTGASVAGRTLARTAAVTMDANAVKAPKPEKTNEDNGCKSVEDNDRETGAARPAPAIPRDSVNATHTAHIVEWDLPAEADARPGAMIVDTQGHDNNRLWFVTRVGLVGGPRVYRFDPAKSLMKGKASYKSWALADDSITTGGLKRIKASCDRRYIFVRTASSLQRVDTQNGERMVWRDQPGSFNVSDLAIDDRNNIFTTGAEEPVQDPTNPDPARSYVQRLTPGRYPGDLAKVTRWIVGGGAGMCAPLPERTTESFPCVSGIAVHPSDRNIVFYSEPGGVDPSTGLSFGNNIAALNIKTHTVRRWNLSALGPDVNQPRQLMIDRFGQVWVITGSGHLVSLDNKRHNLMRKHAIPLNALSDPFGLAPDDDVVGYTDAGRNRIGMLFPKGPSVPVPSKATFLGDPDESTTLGVSEPANPIGCPNCVEPKGKVVEATITTDLQDGSVFVEANLASGSPVPNDSTSPLGITANRGKAQGTFFYAVGSATRNPTANRVGFVRLSMPEKVRHSRDDDDNEDGWDHNDHPDGWHHGHDDDDGDGRDDDRDGLDNEHDSSGHREKTDVSDDGPLGAGESREYTVATSASSLALIATATADNLMSVIGVEIYDGAGNLRARSGTPGIAVATVPLPGAGTYRVRVRNHGVTSIVHTTKFIVRELWQD